MPAALPGPPLILTTQRLTRTLTITVEADNIEDCEAGADAIQSAAEKEAQGWRTDTRAEVLFEGDDWETEE